MISGLMVKQIKKFLSAQKFNPQNSKVIRLLKNKLLNIGCIISILVVLILLLDSSWGSFKIHVFLQSKLIPKQNPYFLNFLDAVVPKGVLTTKIFWCVYKYEFITKATKLQTQSHSILCLLIVLVFGSNLGIYFSRLKAPIRAKAPKLELQAPTQTKIMLADG